MTHDAALPDNASTERLAARIGGADRVAAITEALALAQANDPAGVSTLLEALDHQNAVLRRQYIVPALVRLGPATRSALVGAATGETRIHPCAAVALARIEPDRLPSLLPALIETLESADVQARADAAWALATLGAQARPAVPGLIARVADDRERDRVRLDAVEALAAIREPADRITAALMTAADVGPPVVRRRSVQALGTMATRARVAVGALHAHLNRTDEDFPLRVEAAYALARIGAPADSVTPALAGALQDRDWWVRLFAARGLALLGPTAAEAVPSLVSALGDVEWNVRRNAAYALAQLGEVAAAAVPPLLATLAPNDLGGLGAEALGRIGPSGIAALTGKLHTGADDVRRIVAYGLLKVGALDPSAASPPAPRFTDFLIEGPDRTLAAGERRDFEALYEEQVAPADGRIIAYTLPYPKFRFLRFLVDHRDIILHGSNNPAIAVLQPVRQSTDANAWGNIHGVYADPDGVRPVYFAVVNRAVVGGLSNGYDDVQTAGGATRRYLFAIDAESLRRRPWIGGMVYLLPRSRFRKVQEGEWVCEETIRPWAGLPVSPVDFPCLEQVCGIDWRLGSPSFERGQYSYLSDVQFMAVRPSRRGVPAFDGFGAP